MPHTRRQRLALVLTRLIAGRHFLSTLTAPLNTETGWTTLTGRPHDRDAAELQKLYLDALEAWRKNPIAKRIVDVITDYTLGDGLKPSAPGEIGRFIEAWWNHPLNHMPLRLPELCDELTRAGDIFPTLHTNPADGMSYVRLIPKDSIHQVICAENDWETELVYTEASYQIGDQPRTWLSPYHPDAGAAPAVMLHYAINRPIGAIFGDGDLNTLTPWLLRYSRMLEDRVRLHWAIRAFLWIVTVPPNAVASKQAQYAAPPESGSVIVTDTAETWQAVTPSLHGADAAHDMRAVRMMIDAGSAVPPHWRGEGSDVNLATAQAMQDPAVRHLRRRQLHLQHIITDLAHHSYSRAYALGRVRTKPNRQAITVELPDISRDDNLQLAQAAKELAAALKETAAQLPGRSDTLTKLALSLVLRFAGETTADADAILQEAKASPWPTPKPTTNESNSQPPTPPAAIAPD